MNRDPLTRLAKSGRIGSVLAALIVVALCGLYVFLVPPLIVLYIGRGVRNAASAIWRTITTRKDSTS